MGKLFKLLGAFAVIGAGLSAMIYFLQKRGFLKVEVNYDDKEGRPVTKALDEIVDDAVSSASETIGSKVTEVASDVKNKFEQAAGKQTGNNFTSPSPLEEFAGEE